MFRCKAWNLQVHDPYHVDYSIKAKLLNAVRTKYDMYSVGSVFIMH